MARRHRWPSTSNSTVVVDSQSFTSNATLFDLNEDCMRRILSYLRPNYRFKFALACNHFDEVFASFLRRDVFIMRECIQNFSLADTKQILHRFGPFIRRLSLRQTIGEDNIEFYKLLPRYCHYLETIELQRNLKPFDDELDIYKEIMQVSKNLRSIQIFQNRNRDLISDIEIMLYQIWGYALCFLISTLESLRSLHYSDSSLLGTNLSNLKNLTDLNISFCSSFTSNNFIDICRAVKLQSLNINNCIQLDDMALVTLVETQTELKQLTVSNNLIAHNFEIIGRLCNLRQLTLIDRDSKKLCELMSELSRCHRDDLEVLKISANCILFNSEFRQNLLSFPNLKVYYPSNVVVPDNEYLTEVATKLPKLEKIKIRFCGDGVNTSEGFVNMLKIAKNLSELILDYSQSEESCKFNLEFLRKIVETRKEMNLKPLTLHLLHGTVAHDVLRSRIYRDNLNIVHIRRHRPQYIHRI